MRINIVALRSPWPRGLGTRTLRPHVNLLGVVPLQSPGHDRGRQENGAMTSAKKSTVGAIAMTAATGWADTGTEAPPRPKPATEAQTEIAPSSYVSLSPSIFLSLSLSLCASGGMGSVGIATSKKDRCHGHRGLPTPSAHAAGTSDTTFARQTTPPLHHEHTTQEQTTFHDIAPHSEKRDATSRPCPATLLSNASTYALLTTPSHPSRRLIS